MGKNACMGHAEEKGKLIKQRHFDIPNIIPILHVKNLESNLLYE